MTKLWIALPIILLLAGCTKGELALVQDHYTVVTPPNELYTCPQLASLPNPDTLTDIQVARLIAKLDENNKICGASMKSLKQFYANAKRTLEH